jgi:glycosyltransferase involved in cell wall biosynthesis
MTRRFACSRKPHAMVFPIDWPEPFGLVMAEAMACGVPVVARRRGAAIELVQHGRTGFLSEHEEEMADAVCRVAGLDRDACRRRVASHFSSARMAEDYEKLFNELVEGA